MPAVMNAATDVSCCPVCGAKQGGTDAACPVLKDWVMEAKMLYIFEAVKRSAQEVDPEVRRFWRDAISHYLAQQQSFVFAGEEIKLVYTRRGVLHALCLPRILADSDARSETRTLASMIPTCKGSSAPTRALLQHTARRLAETSIGVTRWALRTLLMSPVQAVWLYVIGHDGEYDEDIEVEEKSEDDVAMKTFRVHVGLCHAAGKLVAAYFEQRIDVERTVSLTEDYDEEGQGEGHGANRTAMPTTSSGGACSFRQVCRLAAATFASSSSFSSTSVSSSAVAASILKKASRQDCEVLAYMMVQQGMAVLEGNYLKILCGSGKGKVVTDTDRKVLEFRLRVNKLERVLAEREVDMGQAKQRAMALHRQGLSAQAAVELWRYKKLTSLVEKLRGAVVNLVSIHYSIEGVTTDIEIFAGLRGGNEALKQQQAAARGRGLKDVMDVEDALREAQELISETNEIGMALSGPVAAGEARVGEGNEGKEEDAELLRELEALELVEREDKQILEEVKKQGKDEVVISYDFPDISHLPHVEGTEMEPVCRAPSTGKKKLLD
ncbi:hypothetical protein VYU27_001267 [Nannochloropsis oceanica]